MCVYLNSPLKIHRSNLSKRAALILKEYVNSSDEKKAELAKSIEAGGSQEL